MDLRPFLDTLRDDLARTTALAGDEVRDVATRLVDALEPALRLTFGQLVAEVAAEATALLEGPVLGVRWAGRDPELVVEQLQAPAPTLPPASDDGEGQPASRVSLRLPEALKAQAEARAAEEGVSLNTWLVGAVQLSLGGSPRGTGAAAGARTARGRLTGWA